MSATSAETSLGGDRVVADRLDVAAVLGEHVVVLAPLLLPAALEPGGEVVGGVGRLLRAEQVQRDRVVEVDVLLDHVERDAAVRGDVLGVVLAHQLGGAGHHAVDTGGADEHVVRLLLEHELAGARQRVERRLLQRAQLVLPVAVGEVGEHEERQPVGRLLVERAEDARGVEVAGVALQQRLGLLAPGAPEVGVQQVDHRPEVPALFDVHLEQVAQVVERRRGLAEAALLLDRRGLGVALDDDQALQVGAVLAGHLLPDGLALLLAERDAPVGVALGEEHAPPVVLHDHVVEVRPALAARRRRRCAGRRPRWARPGPSSSTS